MTYLNAAFWDYPQYCDEQYLRASIANNNTSFRRWVITRMLEYGRATDALSLFSIKEIYENMPLLKLSRQSRKPAIIGFTA